MGDGQRIGDAVGSGAYLPAAKSSDGDVSGPGDGPDDYFKVRRCKFVVMQESCPFGAHCHYAHAPGELRPLAVSEHVTAPHWRGRSVSIGIVEHAMFWDLPPLGTIDVVCNRNTCLGNPFAVNADGPDGPLEEPDSDGWHPRLHREVCGAFTEYLLGAVSDTAGPEDLVACVERVGAARSLPLAETWLAQELRLEDIRKALGGLRALISQGRHLRLLCHCRPHVKCHCEVLKDHLDAEAPEACRSPEEVAGASDTAGLDFTGARWPGFGEPQDAEPCATRGKRGPCRREGRALDPGTMKMYCAQCWSQHTMTLKEYAEKKFGGGDGRQAAEGGGTERSGRPRCRFHSRGACRFGEKCWYRHQQ